jgi:hypothetical protein
LFLFCSYDISPFRKHRRERFMDCTIDRQGAAILLIGWLVALVTTLM